MTLTPRQLEILRLSADGLTCHAIGRKLFIGENTVRTHRKGAIKRLGAKTAAHAVAIAYQRGILATPEVEGRIAELNGKLGAKCGEVVDLHRQVDSARAWAVHLEQELAASEKRSEWLYRTGQATLKRWGDEVDALRAMTRERNALSALLRGMARRVGEKRRELSGEKTAARRLLIETSAFGRRDGTTREAS